MARKREDKELGDFKQNGQYAKHFYEWAPALAAGILCEQVKQESYNAALEAERLAGLAENTASASEGSHDEEAARRKADSLSKHAESYASLAISLARHAVEQENAYDALRAELRARCDAHPAYLKYREIQAVTGSKLRAIVDPSCQICFASHPLSQCPILFEGLMTKPLTGGHSKKLRGFQDRMGFDKDFREAMQYLRSKFTVSGGPTVEVMPLIRHRTNDAPQSAINLTTDDDGWPMAILYPQTAPSNVDTDPFFGDEDRLVRSFTARWRKGQKSIFGQEPFRDIPSISIVIVWRRWHRTKTASADQFRSVLSLMISNEQLWNQGLYYKGIHIGTKDDKITSDYDWWSYGQFIKESQWLDTTTAPEHTDISTLQSLDARKLVRATLRDVKERVQPITLQALKKREPAALLAWTEYYTKTKRRAITKYGASSGQARLLNRRLTDGENKCVKGSRRPVRRCLSHLHGVLFGSDPGIVTPLLLLQLFIRLALERTERGRGESPPVPTPPLTQPPAPGQPRLKYAQRREYIQNPNILTFSLLPQMVLLSIASHETQGTRTDQFPATPTPLLGRLAASK
ncbi:hypothetical protein Daus18300_005032 [Diaporthe australafricana]|uniref:Uncharacterized protein n=1 Tax=Diaporthe australafricana TaxID=127596 RepID=A0ABR3X4W3_9PEZI